MNKKLFKIMILELLVIMLVVLTGCNDSKEKTKVENEVETKEKQISLYPVKDNDTMRYGYVDKNGKWFIEPQYMLAEGFDSSTGLAKVKTSNDNFSVGYIDQKGNMVIKAQYGANSHSFCNGYAAVETKDEGSSKYNTYALIDKDGKTIISGKKYIQMTDVGKNGLIGVVESSEMKYIKLDGTVVIEKGFGSTGSKFYDCGIAYVSPKLEGDTKYILINENGEQIGTTQYKEISGFNENGFAFASKFGASSSETKGIINKLGEFVVEPKFKSVYYEFNNNGLNMAKNVNGKLYGIVNEKGEWVVEPQYVEADRLLDGSWVVKLENNKHQVIGNDGNIIVNEF